MNGQDVHYIATSARWILGLVLFAAGLAKLRSPARFAKAIEAYGILPDYLTPLVVRLLPGAEILLGSLLLVGVRVVMASVVASVLLVSFTLAMMLSLKHGAAVECGCFGEVASEPIGGGTLLRNLLLLAASLTTAAVGSPYLALSPGAVRIGADIPNPWDGIPLAFLTAYTVGAYVLGVTLLRVHEAARRWWEARL